MFQAKVILDSVSPEGVRLTTVEATYPRFIHSELMTHRAFARNAASSRAIPWRHKSPNCMVARIMNDPVIPEYLGAEKKGMQAGDELQGEDREKAIQIIKEMRDFNLRKCDDLASLGLHKSIVNRYVEPWMWITTLITATDWKNFFRLRIHPAAERHFAKIAAMIRDAMDASVPTLVEYNQWHTPYLRPTEDGPVILKYATDNSWEIEQVRKYVSTGRCARLSYLTHDGRRDISEDIRLCNQLINPRSAGLDDDVIHASPLEHVNTPLRNPSDRSGPFRGWFQFRKEFPNENVL